VSTETVIGWSLPALHVVSAPAGESWSACGVMMQPTMLAFAACRHMCDQGVRGGFHDSVLRNSATEKSAGSLIPRHDRAPPGDDRVRSQDWVFSLSAPNNSGPR
jgi:hypothetical protein